MTLKSRGFTTIEEKESGEGVGETYLSRQG